MPAFNKADVYKNVNDFSNSPWEVRNIPGRGNGLFATKTLQRGDLILADTPVGVYMSDAFFPDYEIGYTYLHKTFEQLPSETQDLFMKMAVHNSGDAVMERINTNAFAGEFEGEPHFLLYPETAFMNHDCRPNTMYDHNPKTLVHSTYASRTIQKGEEITITYINLFQTRTQRQSTLQELWGFQCSCSLCTSSHTTNSASEARVSKIVNLQTMLADYSRSSSASPAMAEKLLHLYDREGIHAARGTGHMFAALAYNAVADIEMARKHAGEAIRVGIVGNADPEGDLAQMNKILEKPRRHWSFGARI